MAIILIDPNNSIALGHNNLPNDFLRNVGRVKKPILGDIARMVFLLKLDELAGTHPKVVDVPAFEDVSEVLAEEQTDELVVLVNHVDP
jgi:hypothetical protein